MTTQYTTDSSTNHVPDEAEERVSENECMVQKAVSRHQEAFIPTVFNRKERKLVRNQLMAELEQGFEHRRKALDLVLETRLHSIREACNHLLVRGKTQLRQQRTAYFSRVYEQVAQDIDQLSTRFLSDIDLRFQKLEQYKTDYVREREKKRLEKSVDDFLDTLDQLMDEFRHIAQENVDYQQV
ncbi:hypothetical protein DSCO28_04900 [Desulfosarcina ovata subsp. sediminis]|uniref:Uncharacterized protein n=1 Tax=Desulfosarcina ovata subsp. sediminis TaxID=885957 RepID=A0A5K7ZF71_9BACT|nr:hypothetical protein [Desulfosarcina ovata]BBO79924.1 hypothetical protein DSCO28_04900 [Desulfosarcina ovata subsp. sediminis]